MACIKDLTSRYYFSIQGQWHRLVVEACRGRGRNRSSTLRRQHRSGKWALHQPSSSPTSTALPSHSIWKRGHEEEPDSVAAWVSPLPEGHTFHAPSWVRTPMRTRGKRVLEPELVCKEPAWGMPRCAHCASDMQPPPAWRCCAATWPVTRTGCELGPASPRRPYTHWQRPAECQAMLAMGQSFSHALSRAQEEQACWNKQTC